MLGARDLDRRAAEALPWLPFRFPHLNWKWLIQAAVDQNRQNRLGFVVALAAEMASVKGNKSLANHLLAQRDALSRLRLTVEDTLANDSMTEPQRKFLRTNRSPEAVHWKLLTNLQVSHLKHDLY